MNDESNNDTRRNEPNRANIPVQTGTGASSKAALVNPKTGPDNRSKEKSDPHKKPSERSPDERRVPMKPHPDRHPDKRISVTERDKTLD